MKKRNIVFIISTIISVIIAIAISQLIFHKMNRQDYSLTEYSFDKIPDFTFTVAGTETQPINITKEDLKNKSIKVYKFSKDINNNWENVTDNYIGIKFKDILTAYELEYSDIEFYETDRYSTKFTKDQINDDIYVIFYRNGKRFGDIEPISLISFKDKWNKSLKDFNYVFLHQDIQIDDSSKVENPYDESDVSAP